MSKDFKVDKLQVKVYEDTQVMSKVAAEFVAGKLKEAIAEKDFANLILATGASQFAMIENLLKQEVEWNKINIFHLDEYKGIPVTHPASFRKYLKDRIIDKINPKSVHYINGDAPDAEAEAMRYENLLKDFPIDVACIGIGENGHIAFNDPPVADFNDPRLVKVVELDEACRKQQLGEGWFPTFEDVPTHALTQTIPAILRSKTISCVVPDERKSEAVYNTINGEITTKCPASILRTHEGTILFLDAPAASKLEY